MRAPSSRACSSSLVGALDRWTVLTCCTTDNALETQSHYILLDSPMVCFMMAAACCWSQFLRQRSQAFSKLWWALLAGTGIFLACAMSVKVVGIFVIAVIGLSTARDLWELIADPKNTYVSSLLPPLQAPSDVFSLLFAVCDVETFAGACCLPYRLAPFHLLFLLLHPPGRPQIPRSGLTDDEHALPPQPRRRSWQASGHVCRWIFPPSSFPLFRGHC